MAKIRGVKPEFWTDENVVELTIPARLLFIGLWNYACDNGHIDDKPKQIKMRILPVDDIDVEPLLAELVDRGRIIRKSGVITIPKFSDHQRPHKRWWTTCDLPWCKHPDTPSQQGNNRGQPLHNGGPTDTDVTDVTDGDRDDSRNNGGPTVEHEEAKTRKRPEKPIPDDWQPNDKHAKYATERNLDLAREAFTFRNHAHTHDRRCVNWNAAFTNWLAKAHPSKIAGTGTRGQQPEGW